MLSLNFGKDPLSLVNLHKKSAQEMASDRKPCVVITGNSEEFCGNISKMLINRDIQVVRTTSTIELKRVVQLYKVDLMLFSMDFANEHTAELLKELRKSARGGIKIILVANFSLMAMKFSLSAGFDDFAALPIGEEEIIALMKSSLDHHDLESKTL